MKRYLSCFILFVLLFMASGCAEKNSNTAIGEVPSAVERSGDELDMLLDDDFLDDELSAEQDYYDPLEPMNRVFFEFNDKLYYWVLNPLNKVYSAVLPQDVRFSVGNFINNFAAPVRLINTLLQLKLNDAGAVLARFVINSTLGVYGFGDVAWRELGIKPREGDFGQTLGYWGVGEGVYLCLPVIGPSNIRDTVGFVTDSYSHPMVFFVDDFLVSAGYYSLERVNVLSLNPDAYEDLKKYSLDPYVSMRQVYLDYRRKKFDHNN